MEPWVVEPEDREYLEYQAYVPAGEFEAWLAEHEIEHELWDYYPKQKRKKKHWIGTCDLEGNLLVLAKLRFWS